MKKIMMLLWASIFLMSVPVSAAVLTQYSFENNLLDTGAGGTVSDDLTEVVGTASYVAGVAGRAVVFDQANGLGLLDVVDSADDIAASSAWTIEMFVNSTMIDESTEWSRLVIKWGPPTSYHFAVRCGGLDLYTSPDGNAQIETIPNSASTTVPSDGKWHHLAIVNDSNDSTSGLKAYVDGVNVYTGAGVTVADNTSNLGLGNWSPYFDANMGFNGLMDEVLFHNVAVDEAYIRDRAALLTLGIPVNVSPEDGQGNVSASTVLQWKASRDPSDPLSPDPDSASFIVYCDPNQLLVENATYDNHAGITFYSDQAFMGVIDDDPIQMFDPSGNLPLSMTYYWRVDCRLTTAIEPNDVFNGPVWSFNTDPKPSIVTQPVSRVQFDTADAVFTVVASDPTDPQSNSGLTYQWYYSADNANDTPSDDMELTGETAAVLTVSNPLNAADEGYYYCSVGNSGGDVLTNPAYLFIKDLINYWQFDGDLVDTANGYDAIYLHGSVDPNNPTFVAGKVGAGAIEFSGAQGVTATVGDDMYPGQGGEMTITAWVKAASKPIWASIVKSWNDQNGGLVHFGLDGTGYALDVYISQSNGVQLNLNEGIEFPVDAWQFVAVVADGTKLRLYRNGLEVKNVDYDGTLLHTFPYIGIGQKPTDAGGLGTLGFWDGQIDDVQIYNYARTPEEIVDEYGLPVCLYPAGSADVTGDCVVNLEDFAVIALNWLYNGCYPAGSACAGTP